MVDIYLLKKGLIDDDEEKEKQGEIHLAGSNGHRTCTYSKIIICDI